MTTLPDIAEQTKKELAQGLWPSWPFTRLSQAEIARIEKKEKERVRERWEEALW